MEESVKVEVVRHGGEEINWENLEGRSVGGGSRMVCPSDSPGVFSVRDFLSENFCQTASLLLFNFKYELFDRKLFMLGFDGGVTSAHVGKGAVGRRLVVVLLLKAFDEVVGVVEDKRGFGDEAE